MANEVCMRTKELKNPSSIKTYMSVGGYTTWKKILAGELSAEQIIQQLKESELRGRGGAGFPTGLKWSFMPRNIPGQKYVVCNSDEGEPGTCKDREILTLNPHQLIEGMAICGFVIGATVGYNYVRAEFYKPIDIFENALSEATQAGLLGKNILDSGIDFELFTSIGAGAYICGEETALLESLEGKKGQPRYKPPFPANYGLYGKPTNINNTETFASVPPILEKGAQWFRDLGVPKSGGTKMFCISGDVTSPGVYELGLGTSFKDILALVGGMKDGKKIKAVIPGGSSCKILTGKEMETMKMDYESLSSAGSMLGSGAIVVLNEDRCMVEMLARIAEFYHEESCGQCTPCREGTGWMSNVLHRLSRGDGTTEDIDNLYRVAKNIEGKTICALGEAAAWPVESYIEKFRNEFEKKIAIKKKAI